MPRESLLSGGKRQSRVRSRFLKQTTGVAMGDFSQNGWVTTLHNFKTRSTDELEKDLELFSGYRPMELILPSLYSELEGPALKHIVEQISQVKYLSHVVIGLDRADRDQYEYDSAQAVP